MNAIGTRLLDLRSLGTDPMIAASGRKASSPRVSTKFSRGVDNERAEAGQDNGIRLARSNY